MANDYACELELCMGEWLDECMRNGTKRLSISINTEALKFITCNHTDMHSCLATIKTGNINR
jgi:hypothetical protein